MEFDRIRRILSRIEDGTYGFCRECQEEIPPVRLKCDGADTTTCVRSRRSIVVALGGFFISGKTNLNTVLWCFGEVG